MITIHTFTCDRTCPAYEQQQDGLFMCRFQPLLSALGQNVVHSHTATIKTEYDNLDAFKAAVHALGGLWLGQGKHSLGDTIQSGHGFRLPMADGLTCINGVNYWYHPLVLRGDKELAYDAYGGRWGDISGLERLKNEYNIQLAIQKASELGWTHEREGDRLTIFHPKGGTLRIEGGSLELQGFIGGECHKAREQLGLDVSDIVETKAACQAQVNVRG